MQRDSSSSEIKLIQGGMGLGISTNKLAQAVAKAGERLDKPVLGVVSGIGLATMLVLRLRKGDQDTRHALKAFPVPEIANEILDRYWLQDSNSGKSRLPPKPEVLVAGSEEQRVELERVLMVANFSEVLLAKQGHSSPIGINYLEKVQLPRLPEMFGALLAGVDYVLMGAGIPNQVPGALDDLAGWQRAKYRIDVAGSNKYEMSFDPQTAIPNRYRMELQRPNFLAIVSHHVLAQALVQKSTGKVDGLVIEGPIAGGHNAPARGKEISKSGEPIYGKRDEPDLAKISALGIPFWLAGGYASRKKLQEAISRGATGIQVGSAFALCNESGMRNDLKQQLRAMIFSGSIEVLANPTVSPSGYPFQVVILKGSLSDLNVYKERGRVCSLGYLVEAYTGPDGKIRFRCSAEPPKTFVGKGGDIEKTTGKVCLCNGLAATAQDGQRPEAPDEPPIVTLGQDLNFIPNLLGSKDGSYSAADVISLILD